MGCSTPGFPVHHQLLGLAQTHVHWVSDAIQPSRSCRSLLLPSIFPSILLTLGVHLWVSGVILACNFLFEGCLFLVLVSGCCWLHRMSLEVFLPLSFFWNSLRRMDVNSSLNIWQNLPVKLSGLGLLLGGFFFFLFACLFLLLVEKEMARFLSGKFHGQRSLAGYTPQGCKELDTTEWLTLYYWLIFTTGSQYLHILLHPDSVLGHCVFLGIDLFLLDCPFCWHVIVVLFYDTLYFYGLVITSLNFWFYLRPLFFFFLSLAKGLPVSFIFSNKQFLISLICIIIIS